MVSASPMIAPTVMRGLSEANGSWKMICMSRQSARSAAASSAVDVAALEPDLARRSARSAAGCSGRWSICRSRIRRPARASRPAPMSKLTPSTACTVSASRDEQPAADREILDQVLDAQQRLGHCAATSSSCTSTQATLWPGADVAQRRHRLAAFRHRVAAARREAAAGRRVEQARHHAGDGLEPRLAGRRRVDARDRADQALRVGMARVGEQLRRPAPPRSPCRHTSRRRAARSRRPRPWRG